MCCRGEVTCILQRVVPLHGTRGALHGGLHGGLHGACGRAGDGVPGGDARQLVRRERRPLLDVLEERGACDAASGERGLRAVVGAGHRCAQVAYGLGLGLGSVP